jgi:hypothetical protein
MGWNDFHGVGVLAVTKGPESFCGDDKGAADSYQGGKAETVRVLIVRLPGGSLAEG